ncbi:MAG: hypothetical protein ACTSWW_09270 [Promethearchaeota archaeon]
MYCYILDKGKGDWMESENLFPHDVALLIDSDARKIYLYYGTKSTPDEKILAKGLVSTLMTKYQTYNFEILDDVIPLKIQAEIDLLLGENIDVSRDKEPRTMSLWFFLGLSCGVILIHVLNLFNTIRVFGWPHELSSYSVAPDQFYSVFSTSILLAWIAIGVYGALISVSFFTKRILLVTIAIVGCVISVGVLIYLQQRTFIFGFAIEDPFEIVRLQLFIHFFWLLLATVITTGIAGWGLYLIFTQTFPIQKEEVDIEQIRLASKPTILRDKPAAVMQEIKETENEK